jgi:hypothetical protein
MRASETPEYSKRHGSRTLRNERSTVSRSSWSVSPTFILLAAAACGGGSDDAVGGSETDSGAQNGSGGSGSSASFSLTGTVSNPLTNIQTGRLVAGVIPRTMFVPPIKCTSFVVKDDRAGVSLPAPYSLQNLVAGDYVLAALLIDGTSTDAQFAAYGVTVERDGVHYNSPMPTPTMDLVIQGTVAYDCP